MSVYRDLHDDVSPACYCTLLAVDVQTRWSESSELPSSASTWESLGVESVWYLCSVVSPSSCVLHAANWKGRLLGAIGSLWATKLCVRLEGGVCSKSSEFKSNLMSFSWQTGIWLLQISVSLKQCSWLGIFAFQSLSVEKAFCRHSDQSVDELCLIEL